MDQMHITDLEQGFKQGATLFVKKIEVPEPIFKYVWTKDCKLIELSQNLRQNVTKQLA